MKRQFPVHNFRSNVKGLLVALCLIAGVVSCDDDNPLNNPPRVNVAIRDDFFEPVTIIVPVGRTVVWNHQGSNAHTVTSGLPNSDPGRLFDSSPILPGGSFLFTFSEAGIYRYFCRIHGSAMSGTVEVR